LQGVKKFDWLGNNKVLFFKLLQYFVIFDDQK